MKVEFNFVKVCFHFIKYGFNFANRPRTAVAKTHSTVPGSEKPSPQRPENSDYSGFMPQSIRSIPVLCRGPRRRRVTK